MIIVTLLPRQKGMREVIPSPAKYSEFCNHFFIRTKSLNFCWFSKWALLLLVDIVINSYKISSQMNVNIFYTFDYQNSVKIMINWVFKFLHNIFCSGRLNPHLYKLGPPTVLMRKTIQIKKYFSNDAQHSYTIRVGVF